MRVQNIGSMFHPVFMDLDEITTYREFCQTADLENTQIFFKRCKIKVFSFCGIKFYII